ncbi:hypothetical protein [Hansschlegelia sp. KR7-227]|uniref:hypothetical protein n=1 Tax=Hansschlegelia sp. KR7-227 TaxID=3400914 RepID=UPI003C09E6B5
MNKKDNNNKKHDEYIYAQTKPDVSGYTFSFGPRGELILGEGFESAYSETSYERKKGPKVVRRITQPTSGTYFDSADALESHFDFFCAIDTNTRRVGDHRVSATALVSFEAVWAPVKGELDRFWRPDSPVAILFKDPCDKIENLGWLLSLNHIFEAGIIGKDKKLAVIVDSDLSNISSYNKRERPIFDQHLLPQGTTLLYGSADVGGDDIVNKAMRWADDFSSQTFGVVTKDLDRCFKNTPTSRFYTGIRYIEPVVRRGTEARRT